MPTGPNGQRYEVTNGYTRTATFKAAWQKIKRKGWTKSYPRGQKGEYSIWGAIQDSMRHDEFLIDYQEAFIRRLGHHVDHWEVQPHRTKQQVLDLLRDM